MILIIGGRCQGKLSFARKLLCSAGRDNRENDRDSIVADGAADSPDAVLQAEIVNHMELFIRQLMQSGEDTSQFVERFILENQSAVVIADEIGQGIVPVDAFEREYREMAGRLCQRLAAVSAEVYRIVCGVETKIKG